MPSAILLIAHGSRRKTANDDLVHLAEMFRARRPDDIVEIAYLELAEPSIPAGARACIDLGATEVRMLPFFLSAGSHVTQDLEGFRQQFIEQYEGVPFKLCQPIGLHPGIVDILNDRLEEATGGERGASAP